MSAVDDKPTLPTEEKRPLDLPAFPGQAQFDGGTSSGDYYSGLSKRELFAAMAMQGAMHALASQPNEFFDDEKPVDQQEIARDAVRMADALLKELAK